MFRSIPVAAACVLCQPAAAYRTACRLAEALAVECPA